MSTRQLKALGYNRASAARAAKVGRLHRIHRGVYAVGHVDLGWKGRCMGAVLACTPAVASHWSAAWLLGLARYEPTAFDLSVPTRRGHRRREFFVHFARLAEEDVTLADGIPVTSLERTHLDLAARSPRSLPSLLERAEGLKDEEGRHRFDLRRFESLLARTVGHPGHAPLTKALDLYRPSPTVLRSKLEKRFRALLGASSLPVPSHNFNVGPYELDCYWPEHRFCVELDTFGTHGSRRSFEADRKRERILRRDYGIEVERVTDLQLKDEPEEVLAAVAASLERRGPSSYALTAICLNGNIDLMSPAALQALGEPNRVAILDLLRSGEQPVGHLVARLELSQPAVSKHLRVLRDAGLVESRTDAQRRLYRVRPEPLAELDAWLAPYRRLWEQRLDKLEDHLDRRRKKQ